MPVTLFSCFLFCAFRTARTREDICEHVTLENVFLKNATETKSRRQTRGKLTMLRRRQKVTNGGQRGNTQERRATAQRHNSFIYQSVWFTIRIAACHVYHWNTEADLVIASLGTATARFIVNQREPMFLRSRLKRSSTARWHGV